MGKTLTMVLFSGYQENEDPIFAVKFAEAALEKGHKVNIFLYGNGCNTANKEKPIEGHLHVTPELKKHMDIGKVGDYFEKIAEMGADIATCHTTEYGRGTEADEYRPGIKWGDVGQSFAGFYVKTDVLLTIGY